MHKRIHANTAANIAGTLVAKLADVVVISRIAPFLGKDGFGKFSLSFDLVAMFSIFVDCGINTILIREIAANPKHGARLLGQAIVVKSILGLLTVCAVNVTAAAAGYSGEMRQLVLIASGALLVSFRLPSSLGVFEPTLIAQLRLGRCRVCGIANQLLALAAVLVGIRLGMSVPYMVAAYVLTALLPGLLLVILSWRGMAPVFNRDWTQGWWLLREGFPIAVAAVCFTVMSRFGVVMLGKLGLNGDVGLYSAAARLCGPLELFSISAIYSLMPIMSANARSHQADRGTLLMSSFVYLVSFQSLMAAGVFFIAPVAIRVIYGEEFASSVAVLQLMALRLPMVAVWQLLTTALVSEQKQHWASVMAACALGLCTILDIVFIPRVSFIVIIVNRLLVSSLLAVAAIAAISACVPRVRALPLLIVWLWGEALVLCVGRVDGFGSLVPASLAVSLFLLPLIMSGTISVRAVLSACGSLFRRDGRPE